MTLPLPPLPYAYDALEPALSGALLATHHLHHHATLVAAREAAEARLAALPPGDPQRAALWQQWGAAASGARLHDCFWAQLAPRGQAAPGPALRHALTRDFGGWESWAAALMALAGEVANGWLLLLQDGLTGRLRHLLVEGDVRGAACGGTVLVALDLWEHAYLPQFGPHRADYVRALLDHLDWAVVEQRLRGAPPTWAEAQAAPGLLRGISPQTVRWHRALAAEASAMPPPLPSGATAPQQAAWLRRANRAAAVQSLHALYWQSLGGAGTVPSGALAAALAQPFGTVAGWQAEVMALADAMEGAGWLLLVWDGAAGRLRLLPLHGDDEGGLWGSRPLVALDLWEHAYFFDYGPRRADYVRAWLDNLDWPRIAARLPLAPFVGSGYS